MQVQAAELIAPADTEYASLDDEALTAISQRFSKWVRAKGLLTVDETAVDRSPAASPLLVLAAPQALAPEDVGQASVLVGSRRTGLRNWEVDWRQNAWLLWSDLASGTVGARRLVSSAKRMQSPQPSGSTKPPSSFDAATVGASVERYRPFTDAAAGRPGPGRHALTAVYLDWLSNTRLLRVGPQPEVEAPPRIALASPGLLPSTLAATDAEPLRLALPGRVAPDAPARVDVAMDLALAEASAFADRDDRGGADPHNGRLLLSATLLLFALDSREPIVVRRLAPAQRSGAAGAPARLKASFAFDLRQAAPSDLPSDRYVAYLVAGARVAGPQVIVIEP